MTASPQKSRKDRILSGLTIASMVFFALSLLALLIGRISDNPTGPLFFFLLLLSVNFSVLRGMICRIELFATLVKGVKDTRDDERPDPSFGSVSTDRETPPSKGAQTSR